MRFIVVILLFLFTSASCAQKPPFDFKGIELGSDISLIEGKSRFSCSDPQNSIADRECTLKFDERETIANAPVELLLLYYYFGKLGSITITFNEKYFSEVAAALTEKYGAGSVKTWAVQNSMGTTFENKIHSWRRGNATLEARRYLGKLDVSCVVYRTDFALEEFERRKGTTFKEKAKDL